MFTFSQAIVRTPGHSMISGLTNANMGLPDYRKALEQHSQYIAALKSCGLQVTVLEAEEAYPDSTFVEDVAVLTPYCAVVTRPAAPSRAGETASIREVLAQYFRQLEEIIAPGTLDGGDVMQVGNHFFIGLSARTNREGAEQLIAILKRYAMTATMVPVNAFLHLKTGVTCVTAQTLLAAGECVARPEFSDFTVLPVPAGQEGAANCIRINDTILMPAGFPGVRQMLTARGEDIVEVDISEYAKIDGGLTCLSLRF